jgi:hypothetical protein
LDVAVPLDRIRKGHHTPEVDAFVIRSGLFYEWDIKIVIVEPARVLDGELAVHALEGLLEL